MVAAPDAETSTDAAVQRPETSEPSGIPEIDVARARAETPGCGRVTHLNSAGTSLPPAPVLDAQLDWLREEAVTGGYELAERRVADIDRTHQAIADLIGAHADEIALVENATFAWHQAFWALPLRPGDVILTCTVEYDAGYITFLQAQRRRGVTIEVIPDDESGQMSMEALARRLEASPDRPGERGRVGLVAVPHIPTNGGLVNPAEEIGRLTRAADVPFLLDACQSVGQVPVDVGAIGCDLLSGTGRKWLRGPRGTGFLYVRRELLDGTHHLGVTGGSVTASGDGGDGGDGGNGGDRGDGVEGIQGIEPPFLDGFGATWVAPDRFELRPDARRFESFESSPAAEVALGVAAAYAQEWGIDAIAARVAVLAADLRERLAALPGVQVHDQGRQLCGIVTFTKDGVDAVDAKQRLVGAGINVSVSQPSFTLLDAVQRQLPPLLRASPHYFNDDTDLDRLTTAIADL